MGLYNIAAHQKAQIPFQCLAAPRRWNRFNASQSASTCLDPPRNRSVIRNRRQLANASPGSCCCSARRSSSASPSRIAGGARAGAGTVPSFFKADPSARSRPSAAATTRLLLLCMLLREHYWAMSKIATRRAARAIVGRGRNLKCRAYLLAPIGLPAGRVSDRSDRSHGVAANWTRKWAAILGVPMPRPSPALRLIGTPRKRTISARGVCHG
jgi:hypothetical protein